MSAGAMSARDLPLESEAAIRADERRKVMEDVEDFLRKRWPTALRHLKEYLDRLPPEREAEAENLASMRKNWADREGEIRADERREVLEEVREEVGPPTQDAFLMVDQLHNLLDQMGADDD